jgi:tripartite-type tricarboxylate transporter receptor subunit TctC
MVSFRMSLAKILWAVVVSVFFWVSLAVSAEFPTRPITLIVQFAPGTSTDIVARKLADEVSKTLGQPVVCVNKAGGGGALGVAEMLRSQPDGYTIGCVNMPVLAIIPHMQGVPFDPLKDVAHICVVQPYEYGLYVKADAPWGNLKELVTYVKSHPGEFVFGSIGVGTTNHLIMARIAKQENLKFKHVPYKGDGELIPAMIGGHVHAAVGSPSAVVPQVKAGNLKLLVVTSKDRWSYLPEVPTLLESGYPFYQSSYFSLAAPAGTPEPVRKKIEEAFRKALQDPAIVAEVESKLFAKLNYSSGQEYAKYIQEQYDFYKTFLREEGLIK